MELWLIRHGLPERIDGGDAPADPGLTDEGHDQARRMADWWGRHELDAVYASPMRRAVETAEPLAAAVGLPIVTDDGLQEFDAHLSFYVPLEELATNKEARDRLIAEWMTPEAEERRQEFRRGVVATVEAIAERHDGGRVAVVCHGGVINAYLTQVVGLLSTIFFEPAYTSVSRATVAGAHRQVISLNETAHLPGLFAPTRFA